MRGIRVLGRFLAFLGLAAAPIAWVMGTSGHFGPAATVWNAVAQLKRNAAPQLEGGDKNWGWWSLSYPSALRMGDHKGISVTYTPIDERHESWPSKMEVVLEAPGLKIETPPATYTFKITKVWDQRRSAGLGQENSNIPETHTWIVTPESELGGHTIILRFEIEPENFRTVPLSVQDALNPDTTRVTAFLPTEASLTVRVVNELGLGRPIVIAWNQVLKALAFILPLPAFAILLKWILERLSGRREQVRGRNRARRSKGN
jgi:hypothetical protein